MVRADEDRRGSPCPVAVDRVAAPLVPLNDLNGFETSFADPHPQAASTGEQFDGFHQSLPSKTRSVCSLIVLYAATRIPDNQVAPRNRLQFGLILQIPLTVTLEFRLPKFQFKLGILASLHVGSECRCQKHPWIKITLRRDLKTRSGAPGSRRSWSRYRNPIPCTRRLTNISGLVSRLQTRDIR